MKVGTYIEENKNLNKLIRKYATEERRSLTLGELTDGKLLALLGPEANDLDQHKQYSALQEIRKRRQC